ncbi:hypothetical protein FC83_GL000207 [Agrilactobacillus composti DSM 18527 = JCM 14202]|uniref:Uncharacterized protein n=2 Tax=Agrilactobacillus TaxID=2767875 RepID=A0A0R1XT39_9LACO|nr:hypothetical protein [Agrilactobacillus composti]KRM32805.1 hypothetical protein FC83_GL000207 [Agrilactobacillus composti DSM 18527 = JCM 14202]
MDFVQALQRLNYSDLKLQAQDIGISLATLKRILAGKNISKQTEKKLTAFLKTHIHHAKLYIDETFLGNAGHTKRMNVSCVFATSSHTFNNFKNTLYPFGWRPGDEVKAAGKNVKVVSQVLSGTATDELKAFYTTVETQYHEVSELTYLAPYLLAALDAISVLDFASIDNFEIVLDMRLEFNADSLVVAEQIMQAYLPLLGCRVKHLQLTARNSREVIGLQYADFVVNLSSRATSQQLTAAHISYLPDKPNTRNQELLILSGLYQRLWQHTVAPETNVPVVEPKMPTNIEYLLDSIREAAYQERNSTDREYFGKLKQALKLCVDKLPKSAQNPINQVKGTEFIDLEARACVALHNDLGMIKLKRTHFNSIKRLIESK